MTKIGGMVAIASRQGPRNVPPSDSEAKYNHAMSNLGQGVYTRLSADLEHSVKLEQRES